MFPLGEVSSGLIATWVMFVPTASTGLWAVIKFGMSLGELREQNRLQQLEINELKRLLEIASKRSTVAYLEMIHQRKLKHDACEKLQATLVTIELYRSEKGRHDSDQLSIAAYREFIRSSQYIPLTTNEEELDKVDLKHPHGA